jgi:hypothetical protein
MEILRPSLCNGTTGWGNREVSGFDCRWVPKVAFQLKLVDSGCFPFFVLIPLETWKNPIGCPFEREARSE